MKPTDYTNEMAVELQEVSKSYPGTPPVNALSKVSISVRKGEFVGIIGASGSGKTTLVKTMLNILLVLQVIVAFMVKQK